MYKKPKGLLKDTVQKRVKGKSSFLRKLEKEQAARAALDVNPPHCANHKTFEYDCLECQDSLEGNENVSVLRKSRR